LNYGWKLPVKRGGKFQNLPEKNCYEKLLKTANITVCYPDEWVIINRRCNSKTGGRIIPSGLLRTRENTEDMWGALS